MVAVKAPALEEALGRVEPSAVADGVVVPLLNGLEHPEVIRQALGARVAPGTIARFSGEATAPGRVVERRRHAARHGCAAGTSRPTW